ncbi:MAG: hypothetical protein AMJ81_06980 [Phycisphaerae bacterium SM23_33]|jgi:hypothetical protein|nr:MAG: hypothetical protein AMJ81_06980 [Phycisphaerae bacterium SM23_33]
MFFRCPGCGRKYGDPLYHGPAGHAPPELCFDCWATQWGLMEMMISRERGNWRRLDVALFLLCQGFSEQQAGEILGVHRNTVINWICRLRKKPEEIPEWLCISSAFAPGSKYTGEGCEHAAQS